MRLQTMQGSEASPGLYVANTMLYEINSACPCSGAMHPRTVTVCAWVMRTCLCAYSIETLGGDQLHLL